MKFGPMGPALPPPARPPTPEEREPRRRTRSGRRPRVNLNCRLRHPSPAIQQSCEPKRRSRRERKSTLIVAARLGERLRNSPDGVDVRPSAGFRSSPISDAWRVRLRSTVMCLLGTPLMMCPARRRSIVGRKPIWAAAFGPSTWLRHVRLGHAPGTIAAWSPAEDAKAPRHH